MPDDIAIKVEDVSKTFKLPHENAGSIKSMLIGFTKRKRGYEVQEALKDVSFEIKKGEFFGIVGRNGSGKSTLLKILAGIYQPSEGTVITNGKLVPFIELGVGFNPELTGRENVFLNGALLGFNRKEMQKMYNEIVAFAELERFMDQKLKNYSSGMQVRLAFSIAIRAQSDILLLDEVLAVGDAAFQQKCFNYFEELKRQKKTVVFVSHDMGAVSRFCTKAILVENGVIKLRGAPDKIADQYTVDNLPSEKSQDETKNTSKGVKSLQVELVSDKNLPRSDEIEVKVTYELKTEFDVALGISIVRNGLSIAEMNSTATLLPGSPNKRQIATFRSKVDSLNPGMYVVNVGLFEKQNMEMVAYKLDCAQFVITGSDLSRGGAAYLTGGWKT